VLLYPGLKVVAEPDVIEILTFVEGIKNAGDRLSRVWRTGAKKLFSKETRWAVLRFP